MHAARVLAWFFHAGIFAGVEKRVFDEG